MPVSAIVTLGFSPPGSVYLIPTLGYSIGAAPEVQTGSIRVASVESGPSIRVRDMVAARITIQSFEASPAGINVGSVEIVP